MNCPRRHISWQSKRLYWEGAPGWRAGGWGNPGWLLCHMACSLGFYGDRISFWIFPGQSFWLRVLPGGARLDQPRWVPERRILGGGRTRGVSLSLSLFFLTIRELFWLMVAYQFYVPYFLTRTSCLKITHADGRHGARPGPRFWAVCFP